MSDPFASLAPTPTTVNGTDPFASPAVTPVSHGTDPFASLAPATSSAAPPSTVIDAQGDASTGSFFQKMFTPLGSPGPYDPSKPLIPEAYSGAVQPGNFQGNDESGGLSSIFPKAHLATALLDTTPEKLNYLQSEYPGTSGNPNWFGEDEKGAIIYSQDGGKNWNSFENWTHNPSSELSTLAVGIPSAMTQAGAALAASPADIATGTPLPSMAASAAGADLADIGKRSIAKALGMTNQIINGPILAHDALVGAASQGIANPINATIGRMSTNYVAGLNPLNANAGASLASDASGGFKELAESGLGPIATRSPDTLPGVPLSTEPLSTIGKYSDILGKGITRGGAAVGGALAGHAVNPGGVLGPLIGAYEGLTDERLIPALSKIPSYALKNGVGSYIYNPAAYALPTVRGLFNASNDQDF